MCVVSMVGDHYNDKWKDLYNQQPTITQPIPVYPSVITVGDNTPIGTNNIFPTREEFDALKKEVEEMKKLLIKAKIYDEKNNEPNCEMEEKITLLKKVAELVGISLNDVFVKK